MGTTPFEAFTETPDYDRAKALGDLLTTTEAADLAAALQLLRDIQHHLVPDDTTEGTRAERLDKLAMMMTAALGRAALRPSPALPAPVGYIAAPGTAIACTNCRTDIHTCDELIFAEGRACCGRCSYTDTHNDVASPARTARLKAAADRVRAGNG